MGFTGEGVMLVAFALLAICLAGGIALVFWWFAGYICITFDWYEIDQNCQIITWLTFVMSGGIVGWRK